MNDFMNLTKVSDFTGKRDSSWKDEIYRAYHGKVYGYLLSRLHNRQDAEDIAADVFVKVYGKLGSFDESKASLSTWIYTVTRNTLTDHYRTRREFAEIPETLGDGYSVEDALCNEETLDQLAEALQRLEKRERDIVILHYYSGSSLKDIADSRGIPYGTVKMLHRKALEKLKYFLE